MLRLPSIGKILGLLLIVFSSTMLMPLAISLVLKDGQPMAFVTGFIAIIVSGSLLWFLNRNADVDLRLRDGFLIVVLFWVVLSVMASIPLILVESPNLSVVEALFEAASGLTTTGATILVGLDQMPKSLLFYRQQLQWIGGMGIIVLAVAVLPILGVGGMQLYRAETPGPIKDNKLTPRIKETAKALWYIYLGLTVCCALGYYAAGMGVFDAICHAFSTVAIGGFSTHDASMGYFDSPAIYFVAIVFMALSGINFSLHFVAVRGRQLRLYWLDSEASTYLCLLAVLTLVCSVVLYSTAYFSDFQDNLINGAFQAVSMMTTTGFTTSNYLLWPSFLPVLLILASTIGGCAGSTAGGMKVVRIMLLYKQGAREIAQHIHPNAVFSIKLGGKPVANPVINAVWGFLSLYILSFVVLYLLMLATGLEPVAAFSSVLACLNNLGPGLGEVVSNYASVSDAGKLILCVAMLLGRLELFSLLVLFSLAFWRS